MSNDAQPREKRIFLSFASQDLKWVRAFTSADRFGLPLGADVQLVNYMDGENLSFGSLQPWLTNQADEASVLIAFVSSDYIAKPDTCGKEWRLGLEGYQKGRLIFVPVLMERAARSWWAKQRAAGQLSELPLDFQYTNFADENGHRLRLPDTGYTEADEKIRSLASEIHKYLDKPAPVEPPPGGPQPVPEVVVLGHPTSHFAEGVEAETSHLCANLESEGLQRYRWGDGWRINAAVRTGPSAIANKKRIFVQPLAPGDAADYSTDKVRTNAQLSAIGSTEARVALWLPRGQADAEFERAAIATQTLSFPSLRNDTPQALAKWLKGLLKPETDLVLQIETIGYPDGTTPPADDTAAIADRVQERFEGVVGGIIIPGPSAWAFYGEEWLQKLILTFEGDRAIVAVHDLNIPNSPDPAEPRKALEEKFRFIEEAIETALSKKPRKLDVFRTALVVRNTDSMPFAKYPSAKWKEWRLLRFENQAAPGSKADPKPDPNSLAVFRKELHQWATSPWTH